MQRTIKSWSSRMLCSPILVNVREIDSLSLGILALLSQPLRNQRTTICEIQRTDIKGQIALPASIGVKIVARISAGVGGGQNGGGQSFQRSFSGG
jgi:hypothetical protein